MPLAASSAVRLVFAHRGGGDHGGRENSAAAFARALRAGVHLESDIRLSRDGEPVLIHDVFTLVDGVPVAPALLSADALAGIGVLRLADLYRMFGTAFELSLDVKVAGAALPAIEVARSAGAVARMWLVHEDRDLLRSIRARDRSVRLVHEATARVRGAPGFDHDRYLDSLAADRVDAQNSPPEAWTAAGVAAAHARGIAAFGSLLNDTARLSQGRSLGLDAVYTDEIAMATAVLGGPVSPPVSRL
jgi:glycerophosphoryl diester phosphodiesterase